MSEPSDQAQTTSASSETAAAKSPFFDGSRWQVPGVGSFKHKSEWHFNGPDLPSGLRKSTWPVPDPKAPFDHEFKASNAYMDDSFLHLVVPGGQTKSPLSGGEVGSTDSDILYASVEMHAIYDLEPGTCAGFFFYKNKNQETDIEYLSDPTSTSNPKHPRGPPPMFYTNQATIEKGTKTHATGPAPNDVTAAHNYRIDWLPGRTAFWIDGVKQNPPADFTTNVPSEPCSFLLNNWSNGDPDWSVGPPAKDNIFKVQWVKMYFNKASDA